MRPPHKCGMIDCDSCKQIGPEIIRPHPRISLINSFVCEFEVEGTILATTNQDRPGMVGVLRTCLDKNGANLDQFQLSRNTRGGEALSLTLVDYDLQDSVVEEIRKQEGITSVCKIVL